LHADAISSLDSGLQTRFAAFGKDFGKFYKDAIVADAINNSGNPSGDVEGAGAGEDGATSLQRVLTARPAEERLQDTVPIKTGVFLKRGGNVCTFGFELLLMNHHLHMPCRSRTGSSVTLL
jgi:hypothetical protein